MIQIQDHILNHEENSYAAFLTTTRSTFNIKTFGTHRCWRKNNYARRQEPPHWRNSTEKNRRPVGATEEEPPFRKLVRTKKSASYYVAPDDNRVLNFQIGKRLRGWGGFKGLFFKSNVTISFYCILDIKIPWGISFCVMLNPVLSYSWYYHQKCIDLSCLLTNPP